MAELFDNTLSFLGLFDGLLPGLLILLAVHFVLTATGFRQKNSRNQSDAGSGSLEAPGDGAAGGDGL